MAAPVVPVIIGGFMVWTVFRRLRRNIGRQRLRKGRIIFSLVIFSVVSLLLLVGNLQSPGMLGGLGAGLLAGALLGVLGLRLTKFETTEAGHFYIPNTHIGVGLTVLFVGRLAYRMWVLNDAGGEHHGPQAFQSPLTLCFFGLIAGYYLVYYTGLFVHTHDKQ